jgi:hypothetical protein
LTIDGLVFETRVRTGAAFLALGGESGSDVGAFFAGFTGVAIGFAFTFALESTKMGWVAGFTSAERVVTMGFATAFDALTGLAASFVLGVGLAGLAEVAEVRADFEWMAFFAFGDTVLLRSSLTDFGLETATLLFATTFLESLTRAFDASSFGFKGLLFAFECFLAVCFFDLVLLLAIMMRCFRVEATGFTALQKSRIEKPSSMNATEPRRESLKYA